MASRIRIDPTDVTEFRSDADFSGRAPALQIEAGTNMVEKIDRLAKRLFHNYQNHDLRGKLFLISGILFCVLPTLGGILLIIAAIDWSKWPQAILALTASAAGLKVGLYAINKANKMIRTIPLGWGAEIKTAEGSYLVSHAEDGAWVCDLTGKAVQHYMGDTIKLHDMRARTLAISHFAMASDGASVSMQASIVWHIWDLNRYLHLTKTPVVILENTVRRNLTHIIRQGKGVALGQNTNRIENFVMDTANLQTYGMCIDTVCVIAIDVIPNGTPLPAQNNQPIRQPAFAQSA